MIAELTELPSIEAWRAACGEFLRACAAAPAARPLDGAALAACRLVLGDEDGARRELLRYAEAWRGAVSSRERFREAFGLVTRHPMTDVRHEAAAALHDAVFVLAARGEDEALSALDATWRREAETDRSWPLESVPPTEEGIIAACLGREAAFLELWDELWEDWVEFDGVSDSPYWHALRALLERDEPRFLAALEARTTEVEARLTAPSPNASASSELLSLTFAREIALVRAARGRAGFAAVGAVPAFAARFWEL